MSERNSGPDWNLLIGLSPILAMVACAVGAVIVGLITGSPCHR